MLGAQHASPKGRRGIDRVVEKVLEELSQKEEIEIALTATHALYGAGVLNLADPLWKSRPLLFAPWQQPIGRFTDMVSTHIGNSISKRSPWRRAWRKALTHVVESAKILEQRVPSALFADCDIFHSTYHGIPPTARRVRGLSCFLTVYDLIPLNTPRHPGARGLQQVFRSLHPQDWVLCISQYVKDDFCARCGFDPSRVFVTPLAASAATFYPCLDAAQIQATRARYGLPAAGPYFLSLSAIEPRKNLAHLIQTFGALAGSQEVPDLSLVLVGSLGPQARAAMQTLIAEAGLEGRVMLTGFVPDEDLAALYSGALAFVFPSLAEGFGLPPLEAMQCGTPVICSNATSLPEVVGAAGLLVSPTDSEGLAQAILHVYQDAPLRAKLSADGLARAAEFSWKRCGDLTVDAYRHAIEQ